MSAMATSTARRVWTFVGGAVVGAAAALLLMPDLGPSPGVSQDLEAPGLTRAAELSAMSRRLDNIEQTLAAVLAAERVDERVPVVADRGGAALPPKSHELLAELNASMQRLEKDLRSHQEAVLEALAEGGWLASPPTLEQLRAGKQEIDEAQVVAVGALIDADPEAAHESVRHMTTEEVLTRFGPPSFTTRTGNWVYITRSSQFVLVFERNYVTRVAKSGY